MTMVANPKVSVGSRGGPEPLQRASTPCVRDTAGFIAYINAALTGELEIGPKPFVR
jgi:hypothetical protein